MNRLYAMLSVGALAALAAGGWWFTARAPENASSIPQSDEQIESLIRDAQKDTDNDGLKDWEELLYGFNPRQKDTDNDGIDDKTEYEALIAKQQTPTTTTTQNTTSTDPNFTDALTRRIFSSYLVAKQQNSFDRDTFNNIIAAIEAETLQEFTPAFTITQYQLTDLSTIVPASRRNALTYRKASKKAMEPLASLKEYELSLYARALESQDPALFAELKKVARFYKIAAQNLLVVPVPEDIKNTHLQLINGFAGIGDILAKMGDPSEDPLKMHILLQQFKQYEKAIQQASEKLRIYFAVRYNIPINE